MKDPEVAAFLKDTRTLLTLPQEAKYAKWCLYEYPFDHQLLSLSPLYRESRKQYLALGGRYFPRVSSTMRSLSSQDLFKNEIDYTPALSELDWFQKNSADMFDPSEQVAALSRFNTISVFHEQNHRIIWPLLPPAPAEERDLIRYLNLAESLVVMLDLALGDEIGAKLSPVFERMKVTYRTGRHSQWKEKSKAAYREYLVAMFCATYYVLELVNTEDVLNAVNFVLPGQKKMNQEAVRRSLDLSEFFTRVTNPQWQERTWKEARDKLIKIHAKSKTDPLYPPEDPLDLEEEFVLARHVLDHFKL